MSDSSVDRPHNANPVLASPMLTREAVGAAAVRLTGHSRRTVSRSIAEFLAAQDRDELIAVVLGALNAHSFINDSAPEEVAARLAVEVLLGTKEGQTHA